MVLNITMGDLPEIPPPPTFQKVIIRGDMGLPMELTITSRQCGAASPLAKPKEYKPCFHRELKGTDVEAGDVVVFHCEFSCQPPPDVVWYKGEDKVVENGDKVLIYTEKNDSMLVLADTHDTDSGEYSVVVSNCLGEISSAAELTVIITEERWIRLQDKAKVRTQNLEAAIKSLSDFEIAANRLETWLNEKAKMLAVLGPIGIEPDILKNQKSQVEVLQDEFDSHRGQLDNLQDAARAILDKQDSNSRSRSPIQQQINEIQDQWDDLKRQLDDRESQVDNVLKESEPFHDDKQDLHDWLIDFGSRISSLPAISQNPEMVKQQREHTKAMQKEADRKKQQLSSMAEHHEQLVRLNPELTAMSEVELKLESVQSPYDDWCRKLDERLGKLQAALVQSQDFEDTLDNMTRWLDSTDKEVSSSRPISARPDVLRRQLIEHEELPKEIIKQVYTYQRLADKLDSLIQESESDPEQRALQQKRDTMISRWDDLDKTVTERKDRLLDCNEKAKEYTDECNQFLPWLRSAEDKLNSLGPVQMKPNAVKRQFDTLQQLRDDISSHKDNHRALNDNSEGLVRCTDVDHTFIRDQVKDTNTRWENLNTDVAKNVAILEGLNNRLSTFQENVNQSSSLLASCEGKLASQDSRRDRLSLDNLKHLQSEIDVLENTIVAVQDNSSGLMSAAPSQADTTQMNDEVDSMVRRYQKLKGVVNEKYMQLEAGNQEVVKFQASLNDISSRLSRKEDDLDRIDPVARDLPTLERQNQDIQSFRDELELLKGTILKAETSYKDIIDHGFMSDPEGFREQIENINKCWSKVRERANGRHADIDRTNARMQDLKHLFDEVNGGLDKAEVEIRGWKPVGADVDSIKRQEKELKAYTRNLEEPLKPRVRDATRLCQNLIQSAVPRVSTTGLEGDLKRMTDRWNSVIEKNNERRGNLNEGLLRCGKFQEALQSLLSWISDKEETVKNQTGPSSDSNVLKAQMSEQQLHDRMITNREPSVSSLREMGEQLAKVSDPQDRMHIQQQLSDMERRWNELKDTIKERRQKLEQTERLARDFDDNVDSMNNWLESRENSFASQNPVATSRSQVRSQMKYQQDMHEDISKHKPALETLQENGQELLKLCAGKERVAVQQRLDTVQNRYDGVTQKSEDRLNQLNQALPLATEFEEQHEDLSKWLDDAEEDLQALDSNALADEQKKEQEKLQQAIDEHKPILEKLNEVGKQLVELSPGPGANNVKDTLQKENKRFDDLSKQVKDVEYQLSAMLEGAQKLEQSLDSLLHWVDETGMELQHASRESVSVDPTGVKDQLKKSKFLDREVNRKSSRVQDVLGAAEKVIEKTTDPKQKARLQELVDNLQSKYEDLANESDNRVDVLEETLPLAMQFSETHRQLAKWLDDMEAELKEEEPIPLEPEEVRKEVEENRFKKKNIAEKKQHLDKLNKIGPELVKLSPGTGASSVQAKVADDNKRYENIKAEVDKKGDKLFDMLQRSSSFVEDLDSMLDELNTYEDKLNRPEAIAADPEPLRRQIKRVRNVQDHVDNQMETVEALRKAGNDMISSAPPGDSHAKELKGKLEKLSSKWDGLARTANQRASDLQETLVAAELFRTELGGTSNTIQELESQLNSEDLPAATTKDLQTQLDIVQAIKEDVESQRQDLDLCQQSGQDLLKLCGDADKPEVQRNLDDLKKSWENLKDGICRREKDLTDQLETAEKFETGLDEMREFIATADGELTTWPPVGVDLETIKQQVDDLKVFKKKLDGKNLELETINQEANKLLTNCEENEKAHVTDPISKVNQNWKDLKEKAQERQHKLEGGLLALGQLESSLDELYKWMDRTEEVLLEKVPLTGDPKHDEVQLAKHRLLQNDLLAHQVSVDSVNKAGQDFLATADNPELAKVIEGKLDTINNKWEDLVQKSEDKEHELEQCLGKAKRFQDQIDQLQDWLEATDKRLSRADPVGGLPDSAKDQLDKHNALMKQFDDKQELLDKLLEEGSNMTDNMGPGGDQQGGLAKTLQELDERWNDSKRNAKVKQTQLEEAMMNANEFDKGLQDFIAWLTVAEKTLTKTKPASTIYDNVNKQIEDHREFVQDVACKREDVDKIESLGTQLKYFSQKKDVIVIKNMLVNVANRYQRVGTRCNEKTRELESGLKFAKQFDENYHMLFDWLDENEKIMDDDRSVGSDPEFLKSQRQKHKEFQKKLSMAQPNYDRVVRAGRNLREKSNPEDTKTINTLLTDLKDKWDLLCGKAVDRQRKLEEALLYSGQFKDALQSLLEWMYQVEPTLMADNPVHGDQDTVMNLMEAHQGFQRDLASRKNNVKSVKKSAKGLMDKSSEDTSHLKTKLDELDTKWYTVCELNGQKHARLEDAMREAEEFNSAVQNLLDSFAATEHSMKFSGPLAEDEDRITEQLENHKDAKRMLDAEKSRLDDVVIQGEDILSKSHPDAIPIVKRHIGILNARWEDIQTLSQQKESRLNDALRKVQDDADLLDQVMEFLEDAERKLHQQDIEPIPEDKDLVEKLLEEHNLFEESIAAKQSDIDRLVKPHKRKRSDSNSGLPISDRSRRGRSSRPRSRDASPAADPVQNPKIAALDNQWKSVWLKAMNRRRALADVQEKQTELETMKNFRFDDWRSRYLKWMQHKKARVMDFFRKLDHDRDGKLSRADFIEGVIGSNFETTHPEMNAVVDYLDPLNEGYIDYKKFMNALYPDSERSKQPASEAEKIANEVERQVCECKCTTKFRVHKLGESKYRFGESQMMRLVRILRSTVMVRVGGGWMALDEFLVKNDPCRAKGRTNIEIKEKFILASGVSQSMAAFRRSRSPSECSTSSVGSSSMSGGPFIKSKRNIKRPWQQGHTSSPRVSTTTRVNPDGSFTRTTRETKSGGDSVTRKSTTRSVTPGYLDTPRSSRGTRARSPLGGVVTKKKIISQRTEVDVDEKKTSVGTQGVVTVRTVTEEERTVTKPTHRHSVTSRLMEPTAASRRKQKAKPAPQRWK